MCLCFQFLCTYYDLHSKMSSYIMNHRKERQLLHTQERKWLLFVVLIKLAYCQSFSTGLQPGPEAVYSKLNTLRSISVPCINGEICNASGRCFPIESGIVYQSHSCINALFRSGAFNQSPTEKRHFSCLWLSSVLHTITACKFTVWMQLSWREPIVLQSANSRSESAAAWRNHNWPRQTEVSQNDKWCFYYS